MHGAFYRNVWTAVPTNKVAEVAAMLKAIQAQEDRAAPRWKAEQVAAKLKEMKLVLSLCSQTPTRDVLLIFILIRYPTKP
jgi:hypothetical protein